MSGKEKQLLSEITSVQSRGGGETEKWNAQERWMESSYLLTYFRCFMDMSHHRHLPCVLAKGVSRVLVSSPNWGTSSSSLR